MDHRCPACKANLGKRKLSQAIVARMEMDCPHCKCRVGLNVHWAEVVVVVFSFCSIVVLGAFGYWLQSQGLVLFALGVAMAGSLALPVLEQTCLRTWPRYQSAVTNPNP